MFPCIIMRRRAPTDEQVNAPALERVALSLPVSEKKRSRQGIGGGQRRANKPEMDIWKS